MSDPESWAEQEREESRDAARHAPDPDRPDPSEYAEDDVSEYAGIEQPITRAERDELRALIAASLNARRFTVRVRRAVRSVFGAPVDHWDIYGPFVGAVVPADLGELLRTLGKDDTTALIFEEGALVIRTADVIGVEIVPDDEQPEQPPCHGDACESCVGDSGESSDPWQQGTQQGEPPW